MPGSPCSSCRISQRSSSSPIERTTTCFTRLAGALLIALGVLVIQIVRHRVEALYSTTVIVRLGLLVALGALFARSSDPFFLAIFAVVGLGVILTSTSLYLDRHSKPA